MKYVIGVDYGTLSARAIVVEQASGHTLSESVYSYPHGVMDRSLPDETPLPGSDWALAHPADYREALKQIIPDAIHKAGIPGSDVTALAITATACTLLPVDQNLVPLCMIPSFANRPHAYAKLWKHHRAQPYANRMTETAEKMQADFLKNYGGKISSEWAVPKVMEVYHEDREVYNAADRFMQISDWLTAWLTGDPEPQNGSIAQYKAMWNRRNGHPSDDYFSAVGEEVPEIVHTKLRGRRLMAGEKAGTLCMEAAEQLGLSRGIAVGMAHTDAHCGALGSGASGEGDYVFIIGTSSCGHLVTSKKVPVSGVTGALTDGLVPGFTCYSAGQACVGDMLDWFIQHSLPQEYVLQAAEAGMNLHQLLERKAALQKPGECGLIALDWFNGNRSTLVNADLTGLLLGLTMETRPEDVYRALLDAIAFGHREIVDQFSRNGMEIRRVILCGGIAHKNDLLIQIMADVLNRPIDVSADPQASALGAAICAAAAMEDIPLGDAVKRMKCGILKTVLPDLRNVSAYEPVYAVYHSLYDYFGRQKPEWMTQLRSRWSMHGKE